MALVEAGYSGDVAVSDRDQQRELQQLQRDLKEADKMIADLHREKALEEERHMLMGLQMNKLRRFDRINAAPLDVETKAKLADLKNQLQLEKKQMGAAKPGGKRGKVETAQDQYDTANAQYAAKVQTLKELKMELEDVKIKTNWDVISTGGPGQRDYMAQENKIKELLTTINKMKDEQEITKQQDAMKTQQTAELVAQVSALRDVADQYERKRQELKEKQREKADIQEDIKTLQRIAQRKEHLMKDLKTDREKRDPQTLKRLESDKKVLQHEIQKHAGARKTNEKSIMAQHRRLLALEAKLSNLADTLGKIHLAPGAPVWGSAESDSHNYRPGVPEGCQSVDVAAFEQVQRQLEEARRGQEMKDILMLEKDAEVEDLEKKVEIHIHAKQSMLKRVKLEKREMNKERAMYQADIDIAQEEHDARTNKLQQELDETGQGISA